jgi:hypothetical protein
MPDIVIITLTPDPVGAWPCEAWVEAEAVQGLGVRRVEEDQGSMLQNSVSAEKNFSASDMGQIQTLNIRKK